jgi:hypothetical protein
MSNGEYNNNSNNNNNNNSSNATQHHHGKSKINVIKISSSNLKENNNHLVSAADYKTSLKMALFSSVNHQSVTGGNLSVVDKLTGKVYPKPPFSYSCLIAMSLRNSDSGNLPVSDIYEFIIENFPYYKTARDGWKNSIRHNLSLNKCFRKIENPTSGSKKGCLWALNPDKCRKLEEECKRCRQRDPVNIRLSMRRPDDIGEIERGEQRVKKYTGSGGGGQQMSSAPLRKQALESLGLIKDLNVPAKITSVSSSLVAPVCNANFSSLITGNLTFGVA